MKLSEKQNDTLFKVFLFGMIEVICCSVFVTLSGIAGHLYWTLEQLTTTPIGMVIQILNLIILVDGIVLFLYLFAFVIMFMVE
ncbi:MAG: hypothetical protein KGD68_05340 [Candidatus Lokiarchaeota archaeon]|nr:hypothetical protein [Candidatus Lokiarchaeota archaeon]